MPSMRDRVLAALEAGGAGTADEVARRFGVGGPVSVIAGVLESLLATHSVVQTRGGRYYLPGNREGTGQPNAEESSPAEFSRASFRGASVCIGDLLIEPDQTFTNAGLARAFGCATRGGMRRSLRTNTLVLITHVSRSREKQPYSDQWIGDTLMYTGMGLYGNQSLTHGQNATLAKSGSNGVMCVLLERPVEGSYRFIGRVRLAGDPVRSEQPDAAGAMREVWMFPLQLADAHTPHRG